MRSLCKLPFVASLATLLTVPCVADTNANGAKLLGCWEHTQGGNGASADPNTVQTGHYIDCYGDKGVETGFTVMADGSEGPWSEAYKLKGDWIVTGGRKAQILALDDKQLKLKMRGVTVTLSRLCRTPAEDTHCARLNVRYAP
jgi:hypothetical protein